MTNKKAPWDQMKVILQEDFDPEEKKVFLTLETLEFYFIRPVHEFLEKLEGHLPQGSRERQVSEPIEITLDLTSIPKAQLKKEGRRTHGRDEIPMSVALEIKLLPYRIAHLQQYYPPSQNTHDCLALLKVFSKMLNKGWDYREQMVVWAPQEVKDVIEPAIERLGEIINAPAHPLPGSWTPIGKHEEKEDE